MGVATPPRIDASVDPSVTGQGLERVLFFCCALLLWCILDYIGEIDPTVVSISILGWPGACSVMVHCARKTN